MSCQPTRRWAGSLFCPVCMKFHGSVAQLWLGNDYSGVVKGQLWDTAQTGRVMRQELMYFNSAGFNSRQGCDAHVPSTQNNCRSLCFAKTSATKELKLISAVPQSGRLKVNELVKLLVSTVAGVNATCGSLHYGTWGCWNGFQQPIVNFKCIKLSSYR